MKNSNPHNVKPVNRQLAELQNTLQRYEQLDRVLDAIWSMSDENEIISYITAQAVELMSADQVTVYLFNPDKNSEARTLIRKGNSHHNLLDHYMNRLMAGWVSHSGRSLLSSDLTTDLGADNITGDYLNITSAISVSLPLADTVLGVMNLIRSDGATPFDETDLLIAERFGHHCARFIHHSRMREKMFAETENLRTVVRNKYTREGLIGYSPRMQEVFLLLDRIVPTDVRVLIQGESGTGKERVAKLLHFEGPRSNAPFVAVDCAAIPANLLESELFGFVRGAFTGAGRDRKGLFSEADGGTLFLDEIANLPGDLQSKLLRVLQENEIRPLGANTVQSVDTRIIAATSTDLPAAVASGSFRQDLFYRLSVITLEIPPLRERRADIAILAQHFLAEMNSRYQKSLSGFSAEALQYLETYGWPGNIRELEHAVERAVILAQDALLTRADFPAFDLPMTNDTALLRPRPLQDAVAEFKKRLITQTLASTGGRQTEAAKILSLQRTYLNRLIKELDLR